MDGAGCNPKYLQLWWHDFQRTTVLHIPILGISYLLLNISLYCTCNDRRVMVRYRNLIIGTDSDDQIQLPVRLEFDEI